MWTQPAFEHDADIASIEGALATFELMRPVLPANYLGLPAPLVAEVKAGWAAYQPRAPRTDGA